MKKILMVAFLLLTISGAQAQGIVRHWDCGRHAQLLGAGIPLLYRRQTFTSGITVIQRAEEFRYMH